MRIYFNKQGDRPWSIDNGPGTYELTMKAVEFRNVSGHFHYVPSAGDNLETPTAWFEADKNAVFIDWSHDTIVIS